MNTIIILAQAGSTFTDFLSQLPAGLLVMTCAVGLILLVSILLIVRARIQRQSTAFMPEATAPARAATTSTPHMDDLPDLDVLLDTPTLATPSKPSATATSPQTQPAQSATDGPNRVTLADGNSTQAVEIVTLLRDVVDGSLIIQMDGKAYRDLSADEQFRTRFLKVMRELSPMVTQNPNTSPTPTPPPARQQPLPQTPPPGALPRFTVEDAPQTIETRSGILGRRKTEFVPVPDLDISGAIEAFLQHQLRTSGQFSGRVIHIHPAQDGGVAIEVDGQFYETVSDVPDEAVRTYLSETIQAWQAQNSAS